jgi:hypothetical protein
MIYIGIDSSFSLLLYFIDLLLFMASMNIHSFKQLLFAQSLPVTFYFEGMACCSDD